MFSSTALAQISEQNKNIAAQLQDVEQKNKYGQVHYVGVAVKMAQQAADRYVHGGECQASCPDGCCDAGAGLIYEGGMFMLLNTQATLQSKEHQMIAKESCLVHNKYANNPRDCSKEIKSFEQTKPEANWLDDKGNCKSSAPPECKAIRMIPGSGIFASRGVNCKKNSDNPCALDFYSTYKSNPDGSITIRIPNRSVNLNMNSFKDKASLMAAGIPASQADGLLAQFKEASRKAFPNGKAAYVALNPEQIKQEISKGINPTEALAQLARQPAAYNPESVEVVPEESLTKNFNGELIHARGSNIFEVMSRRYQKTTESLLP